LKKLVSITALGASCVLAVAWSIRAANDIRHGLPGQPMQEPKRIASWAFANIQPVIALVGLRARLAESL
jgi:hypothetical protein